MADSYNTVSVASTAGGSVIIANLTARRNILIKNVGSVIVYIGWDSSVTASNGFPINPQGSLELSGGFVSRKPAVYGIAASGTGEVRYLLWEY